MNLIQYAISLLNNQNFVLKQTALSGHTPNPSSKFAPKALSFVLPTRDAHELLSNCVESLFEVLDGSEIEFELIVLDNRTSDARALDFLQTLKRRGNVSVISFDRAFNYAEMINIGAKNAKHSIVVPLNNDIEFFDRQTLNHLIDHLSDPQVGVVAPVLTNQDGTIQSSGVCLGINGVAGHITKPLDECSRVSAVSFAIAMFRKDVFEKHDGLDRRYKVGLNDVDFCLRVARSGLKTIICRETSVVHTGSATRGSSFGFRRFFRAAIEVQRFLLQYPNLSDPFFAKTK